MVVFLLFIRRDIASSRCFLRLGKSCLTFPKKSVIDVMWSPVDASTEGEDLTRLLDGHNQSSFL